MQFKTRIIIPLLTLILAGCSMLPNEMKSAEELMEKSPDSALHLLQQIKPNQTFSNADQALYGLLLFEALDKNYLPLRPDSVINYSLDFYQSKNDKPRLAKCYFYKGRMYKYAQRYDEATEFYLKALDNCNNNKDYELLGKIYSDIGNICSLQEEYSKAREKNLLASKFFKLSGKIIDASYKILDIGSTYRCEKNYKNALAYYLKAISQTTDSMFLGVAYQEIGINYHFANKKDSAKKYIKRSITYPYKENDFAIRYYMLSDLFFSEAMYDSAFIYASIALKYPSSFFTQRGCYRILANSKYMKGDFKQMAYYMTRYQACTDSVRKIDTQTRTTILENYHNNTAKAHKTKSYLVVLEWTIPFIIIISSIAFTLLRIKNKRKDKHLKQIELKLNEKQTVLKNTLIQKIEDFKAHQLPEYRRSNLAKREQMDKEAYYNSLHLNEWKLFSETMNKTFNNIVSFLESTYPDLTHKDIIWCCLYLLNTHSTDMAIVLECKPESLYKLKQRLAKKMNFKTTLELNQYLHEKSIGK